MIVYIELKDIDKLTWRLIASSDTFSQILTNKLIYSRFREALHYMSHDEAIIWIEENRYLMLDNSFLLFDAETDDVFHLYDNIIPKINTRYKRDSHLSKILT